MRPQVKILPRQKLNPVLATLLTNEYFPHHHRQRVGSQITMAHDHPMNGPISRITALAPTPAGWPAIAARRLLLLALLCGGLNRPVAAQDGLQPAPVPTALPAGILPDSPLAQVVKLAQAGVDQGIIQAYITNSTSTFNLDPDKIIYLKDDGVPNELVQAMMQRDTVIQAYLAAASIAAPAAAAPNPPPTPTPPPLLADDSQADPSAPEPSPDVTLNTFYDALTPYGSWVNIAGYGECWLPGVTVYNHDWQPYGDQGHWVYTDSGWYWASDYSWGWAPFHYGRWFHSLAFGWCWRPDTLWGPSWVTWRYSDDYCGWAPLPPGAYFQEGVGWVFKGGLVAMDYDFGISPDYYVFVGINDFSGANPIRHRIDHERVGHILHETAVVNNVGHNVHGFVNGGIDPGRITKVTHSNIPVVSIHAAASVTARRSSGEAVTPAGGAAYANRPQPQQSEWNRSAPAPYSRPAPAAQPNNWGTPERAAAPAPESPRYYPPANLQRSAVPAEVYRSAIPAPEPRRLEPVPEPRQFEPEPRTFTPPTAVQHQERPEPPTAQPAPARNNSEPAAPLSKSGKNGN